MARSKQPRADAPGIGELASLQAQIEEARLLAERFWGAAGVNPIVERAAEVIGDREEAFRWLGTPVRALGYATPMSLLATGEGIRQVLAVLDRLEHGLL